MQAGHFGYQFSGLEMEPSERREAFKNWVLSKGFQDLARGVRTTLEEAVLYLRTAAMKHGPTTLAKVEADIAEIRARAGAMRFPQLLEEVNPGLREPMAFEVEFRSLQKVRNCLEHRGGRVGRTDVETGTESLTLSFPRLKLFYLRGDEEVEVAPGEAIDTQAPDNPFGGQTEVPIYFKRVTRNRTYGLGEAVKITASDFFEIAMACHFFAADLAAKLPILPALDDTSVEDGKHPSRE
jgi:hypothetical protein